MSDKLSTQSYKGTRDFYPEDMRFRSWMFGKLRNVVSGYGYQEYEGPMMEPFELYAAKSGEELVNQQLYSMTDRGERKIAVRPEMTPTLARMVAAKVNELPRPVRLYSIPNLWRYERPQKGRLREFWQPNVDVLGGDPAQADAEILSIAYDIIQSFGGGKFIEIRVNNRKLVNEFLDSLGFSDSTTGTKVMKLIDASGKLPEEKFKEEIKKLGVNDSQVSQVQKFMSQKTSAKKYKGHKDLEAVFEALEGSAALDAIVFDPSVVRGLDYYTGTVFEIYDTSGENPRAMFGGGRYDNLIGMFGKESLSGVGFGMGDVGLQNFLETHKLIPEFKSAIDVFVTLPKKELFKTSQEIAQTLRAEGISVMTPLGDGGFGTQLKQSSKHGCRYTVLLGDTELTKKSVMVKDMNTQEQTEVKLTELSSWVKGKLK